MAEVLNVQAFKRHAKKYLGIVGRLMVRDTVRLSLSDDELLLGRMASWHVRSMKELVSLQDAEFKVTSQWGEDGIIEWLVERAEIPFSSHTFIEFGVETYREANTRFLMQNRNWRGLIMDGSSAMVKALEEDDLMWKYDIAAKPAFITRENINQLIIDAGFSGEIGLLSVDIDGNDYWVWEAIDAVNPILVVCEYNAVFGDLYPISVPYDPKFYAAEKHFSYLYFGASISALRSLGEKKGYRFVGTNSMGGNAFFVREDYAAKFFDNAIRRINAAPARVRGSRDSSGKLNFLGGIARLRQIELLPVVNVETGETIQLSELGQVYSPEWASAMANEPHNVLLEGLRK